MKASTADPGRPTSTSRRSSSPEGGRARIVAAAEEVFYERGFDAGTLREIAAKAQVPLGLTTYHFSDKVALYRAVFEARTPELVQQRLAGLALAKLEPLAERRLELIVRALLVPMLGLRATEAGRRFAALLARESTDPSALRRGIVLELLRPVTSAFLTALEGAFPEGGRTACLWAYGSMIGAMLYMMAGGGRMREVTDGVVDPDDVDACTEHLLRIALSGFSSGATAPAPS